MSKILIEQELWDTWYDFLISLEKYHEAFTNETRNQVTEICKLMLDKQLKIKARDEYAKTLKGGK